jgi:hypothetical protein
MEGVEWVWNSGVSEQKVESLQKRIDKLARERALNEQALSLFNEFLNSL